MSDKKLKVVPVNFRDFFTKTVRTTADSRLAACSFSQLPEGNVVETVRTTADSRLAASRRADPAVYGTAGRARSPYHSLKKENLMNDNFLFKISGRISLTQVPRHKNSQCCGSGSKLDPF